MKKNSSSGWYYILAIILIIILIMVFFKNDIHFSPGKSQDVENSKDDTAENNLDLFSLQKEHTQTKTETLVTQAFRDAVSSGVKK